MLNDPIHTIDSKVFVLRKSHIFFQGISLFIVYNVFLSRGIGSSFHSRAFEKLIKNDGIATPLWNGEQPRPSWKRGAAQKYYNIVSIYKPLSMVDH